MTSLKEKDPATEPTYEIVPFNAEVPSDLSKSCELMGTVWGENDFSSIAYNTWLYLKNPNGKVVGHLVWHKESRTLAAQYVAVPASLWFPSMQSNFRVLLSLNTATHPLHQRRGLFGKSANLTFLMAREQEFSAVYGFPNENSLPGFLRADFSQLSQLQIWARPINLLHLGFRFFSVLKNWRSPQLIELEKGLSAPFSKELSFLPKDQKEIKSVIHVPKTREWLEWRYFSHPTRTYFSFSESGAMAILRPMQISGMRICLLMDLLGNIDQTFIQSLHQNLKVQNIDALVGVFPANFSKIYPEGANALWFRVPARFSPKPFHVIFKGLLPGVPSILDSFFSLGDIDIF